MRVGRHFISVAAAAGVWFSDGLSNCGPVDLPQIKSAPARTCIGNILKIDRGGRILIIRDDAGRERAFRFDDQESVIFRGISSIGPDELNSGERVEIDHIDEGKGEHPLVTWIEVLRRGTVP